MKKCKHCGGLKPLEGFHQDRAMKDGHKNVCRDCSSKHGRQRPKHVESKPQSQEERVMSLARQRALKKLVENHYRDFRRLLGRELTLLGAPAKWHSVQS